MDTDTDEDELGRLICNDLYNEGYEFNYVKINPIVLPDRIDGLDRDFSRPENKIIIVSELETIVLAYSGDIIDKDNNNKIRQWLPLYEEISYSNIRKRELTGKNYIRYKFKSKY